MEYLINFLNLLIVKLGGSVSPSSLSASTHSFATDTFCVGFDNLSDYPLTGTTTMSVATVVTNAANEAYEESKYEMNTSHAYVQSLNEDELRYLIGELENLKFDNNIEESSKVLSKTLNYKR